MGRGAVGDACLRLHARETTALSVTVPATLRLLRSGADQRQRRLAVRPHRQPHYFTYGVGVDWRTPDNVWTLTGEVFGLLGTAEEASIGATAVSDRNPVPAGR